MTISAPNVYMYVQYTSRFCHTHTLQSNRAEWPSGYPRANVAARPCNAPRQNIGSKHAAVGTSERPQGKLKGGRRVPKVAVDIGFKGLDPANGKMAGDLAKGTTLWVSLPGAYRSTCRLGPLCPLRL